MKQTADPKRHNHTKIVVSVIAGFVLVAIAAGLYVFSHIPQLVASANVRKATPLIQAAQETQRAHFEHYLQQPTAPKNDQGLEQFIQNNYPMPREPLSGDADYVTGRSYHNGQISIDLVTRRVYTLPSAGGLTNDTFTFVMCTRLSGTVSPTATVTSTDIACGAHADASPTGQSSDTPTRIKLSNPNA